MATDKSKEAMKLALEALEMVDRDDNDRDFLFPSQCYQLDEAITALREALAEQPAQRTWVGLTEAERKKIEKKHIFVEDAIRLTEAKLKEKNNG